MLGFAFKLAVLFIVCTTLYLWAQRKKIADYFIRRELYGLNVYDLDFHLSEISPFRFELVDITWGDAKDPFLYLSSVRAFYTPRGLFKGRFDGVEVGHLTTRVRHDENGRLRFEAQERLMELPGRIRKRYPAGAGAKRGDFAIPDIRIGRGRIEIQDSLGRGLGALESAGFLKGPSGKLDFDCEYGLPGGRRLAVRGSASVLLLAPVSSSLHSEITVDLLLDSLLPNNLAVSPDTVQLRGDLIVSGLDTQPEWCLDFTQMSARPFGIDTGRYAGSAELLAGFKLDGTATNFWGSGGVCLSNAGLSFANPPGGMDVTGRVQSVVANFLLPETAFGAVADANLICKAHVHNLDFRAGDLLALERLKFETEFSVSRHGPDFSAAGLSWDNCEVGGVAFQPVEPLLSATNGLLALKAGVKAVDEELAVILDAVIPLRTPGDSSAGISVPPVRIDSGSGLARLPGMRIPKGAEFGGVVSAEAALERRGQGRAFSGVFRLSDGSFQAGKVAVTGVDVELPFEFDGRARSKGSPLLKIETFDAGNIRMADGRVRFHLLEDELFVESAAIGWAGGFLHAYAVHAGFDGALRNEFTVYADRVDLGSVFALLMPFEGRMEGVLYGRFPVGLNNRRIELSTGYLYSLPGQGGFLKIEEPENMERLLRRAGIRKDVDEIARALSDLELSMIRLDLDPREGDESSLRLKLAGRSNYEKRPAPVDLNLNFNGPLEEILNLGMDLQRVRSR